jgi:hypothetical protein
MADMNNSDDSSPLSTIVGNIARAREIADQNDLGLLSYLLRIAECEAWELVAKADAAGGAHNEARQANRTS